MTLQFGKGHLFLPISNKTGKFYHVYICVQVLLGTFEYTFSTVLKLYVIA